MSEQLPLTNAPMQVRLRVTDYLLLDDAGAFDGYGKTELIEGEVFYMNAQHRPHARLKSRFHLEITKALAAFDGLEALVAGSISIPPHNVPEPDIVITGEPEGDGLIPLASVKLVVEVSDTTLTLDMGTKASLYAANAVPEYWVVDVRGQRLFQMWQPVDGAYTGRREFALGERIEAVTLVGLLVTLPAG